MKKKLPALSARIEEVLVVIDLLPLTSEADRHYGLLRTELETKGTPIGANDMFIAAHALATDCILVTDNVREFRRVRGLKVQNWLRP
jgi:tRNA(fMet)-specific endonuclease VapC